MTLGADSLWIINIARAGYEKEPFNTNIQHTWAYFPLYPLLLHAAAKLTGDLPLTGIVLSSLLFLLALMVLHRTVTEFDYDEATADRTVFYVAAFPASYFFSLAQTESLFLLLTVGCFYAAKRQRWWLAGICGALASATRFAGVFLVVPLAVLYWQNHRGPGKGRIKADVASLLLVPLGLIAFMVYLKSITGNALAFAEIPGGVGAQRGNVLAAARRLFDGPAARQCRLGFQITELCRGGNGPGLQFCSAQEARVGVRVLLAYFDPRAAVVSGFITVDSSLRDGNLSSVCGAGVGGRSPRWTRSFARFSSCCCL